MSDRLRIDSTKIQFHPHRVAQWLDGKDDWETAKSIYPIYMEVSPIGGCNHACRMCGVDYVIQSASSSVPTIPSLIYDDRIHELGELGLKAAMFAGAGEPLLNKRINSMVASTIDAGVDASFTTNGILLDKLNDVHRIKWIKVSINAGTPETYAQVHRTSTKDWDRVWDNLRRIIDHKGQCQIGVQMVLLPENIHEAQQLQDRCDSIGIDYVVFKPFSQQKFSINREYEHFKGIPLVSGSSAVVRTETIKRETIPYDKCHATPYLWCYWEADGDLYSCSAYLLDDRFKLGNLNSHTFKNIWQGEKRRANWEYVRNGLDIHECRLNCRMSPTNIYLDELIKDEINASFI